MPHADSSPLKRRIRGPRHTKPKGAVALFLTFAAGFIDIVGFLTIYRLFTAHMTGTTVHMGEYLVHRDWKAAAIAATVIAAFLVGSIAGRIIIELGSRRSFRRVASIALFLELLLIIAVTSWGSAELHGSHLALSAGIYALVGMLAFAMGLQTAALTRIGPLTVHTTFVTGMLNKLAQLISRWLFLTYDIQRNGSGEGQPELRDQRENTGREVLFIAAIWVAYFAGAVCGTWLRLLWQLRALGVPCALLLAAIIVDQARPLSLEEEQDQTTP